VINRTKLATFFVDTAGRQFKKSVSLFVGN
jgi:hypothetical protein